MPPIALNRIHSILKHAVVMGDDDITIIVNQIEQLMADEGFKTNPQLRSCLTPDGWLPIALLLNYSTLGATVWPFGGVGVVADCLSTRGSTLVEVSGDGGALRKCPLRVQVRSAIEWIFSDQNYHKDVHLQLLQEGDGFVPLSKIISTYSNVKQLNTLLSPEPTKTKNPYLNEKEPLIEALDSSAELVIHSPKRLASPETSKVRRKTLAEKICSQVEWYLAEERLQADRFLYETTCDHDGWIPVSTLLSFPRMRKLCHPQVGAVAHVLSSSPHLEVSTDMSLVRPGKGAPPSSPARAMSGTQIKTKPKLPKRTYEPEKAAAPDFSLMTYNILSDMLCTTEQFPKVVLSDRASSSSSDRVSSPPLTVPPRLPYLAG